MREVLRFLVGVHEQHWVQVYFDKFWGGFRITVDGVPVIEQTRFLSGSTVDRWPLVVGIEEVHQVVVEKERAVFLAGFRRQEMRGIVDGVLVATGEA